jgi:hypothetical protein
MLFAGTTHLAMLATAAVGTVVLGLSMRRLHTWNTVLIWVVPVCVILSATDALLAVLSGPFPAAAMDGGPGDSLRFALCFLALVFPCEIVYQLAINWMADRLTVRREAGASAPAPATSEATAPAEQEP